ncbi:LCP family protein [Candidatus Saccharibacteria bacterium]|nr:LCP family protein [Candidatus Saccharibacteria bacterium]
MSPRKPKNIDGVVKPVKKSTAKRPTRQPVKKPAKIKVIEEVVEEDFPVDKNTPDEAPEEIIVSTDDTEVSILEATDADDSEESASKIVTESFNNAVVNEPDIEPEAEEVEEVEDIEAITPTEAEEAASLKIAVDDSEDNLDKLISDIEEDVNSADKEDKKATKKSDDKASEKRLKPMKKSKKEPAKAKPFRIISRLLALATTGAVVALAVRIVTTGAVPNKYLIPGAAIAAVVLLFYIFKAFRKKTHVWVLIILDIIGIALAAASVFGFIKVEETMAFLNNNFDNNAEYSIYNVIVDKDSNYLTLDDVRGKTFHSISDFVDTEKLEKAAKEQADATIAYADGVTSLLKNAIDDPSYIVLLNSGTYDAALEADEGKTYAGNLKVIGEIRVEVKKDKTAQEVDLANESFVVYISGIDTRSGMMLDRSLSDVNIVMAVNPKTKNILMVSIPRDYYVQLHGTTGLKDKLTHAGSLGGVDLSMTTIEDLLNIKFNRYIRVNFNFVINLVDAVGGITVYSDVNYTFKTLHPENQNCTFYPGNNTVNGACALGFARERYAYSDGDRHRGRNQEQVIEKVFDKVTSSSTLISKYSDILNALSGSFDTNISTGDITSLANMQLSDMAKWTIESYNLDGTTGGAYTYSYPSQILSVMHPDEATVETAKQKIHATLTGETADEETLEEPAAD